MREIKFRSVVTARLRNKTVPCGWFQLLGCWFHDMNLVERCCWGKTTQKTASLRKWNSRATESGSWLTMNFQCAFEITVFCFSFSSTTLKLRQRSIKTKTWPHYINPDWWKEENEKSLTTFCFLSFNEISLVCDLVVILWQVSDFLREDFVLTLKFVSFAIRSSLIVIPVMTCKIPLIDVTKQSTLTPEQILFFQKNGFLVLRNALCRDVIILTLSILIFYYSFIAKILFRF